MANEKSPASDQKRKHAAWSDALDFPLQILFDILTGADVALAFFGILALTVAVPALIVLGGGAIAAHLQGRRGHSKPLTFALFVAGTIALLLFGIGAVAYEEIHSGHPVLVGVLAGAATLVGAAVGIAIRTGREKGPVAQTDLSER